MAAGGETGTAPAHRPPEVRHRPAYPLAKMAASTARLAARRLFLPWSARLVRASGSRDRVGGGPGKGRESRRAQAPRWLPTLVLRLPQWGRGDWRPGGVVHAGICSRGGGEVVALVRRPVAVHGGNCSLRPAEVKVAAHRRDTVIRGPSPGAAGPRVCYLLTGAAVTPYRPPRCRGVGAGAAPGSRSSAVRGLGRDALEWGGSSLRPGTGPAVLTPGELGESVNPPSLPWLDGGCPEAPVPELCPSVIFPILPV